MKLPALAALVAAALLAACVSDNYQPYVTRGTVRPEVKHDQMTLERTACFGFCPVYKVTVLDNDVVTFEGERFVKEIGGSVSRRLSDGSFKKLIEIAKAHDFAAFDAAYPDADGANCPQRATDMPTVIVSFDAQKLSHAVSFYQGCMGFAGRDSLNEMIAEIDAVLDIGDWVGPRKDFTKAKGEGEKD